MASDYSVHPNITFEVLPTGRNGINLFNALDGLEPGDQIAVAASEKCGGMDTTLACSVEAAERGFVVEMHIASRLLSEQDSLPRILEKALAVGIQDVLIIGGEAERSPHLPYPDGLSVVEAIAINYPQLRMRIPGYPPGHPDIPDLVLSRDLRKKEEILRVHPAGGSIETQVGFEAQPILNWIRAIRAEGNQLPVNIGLFGAVGPKKGLNAMRFMGRSKTFEMMNRMGIGLNDLTTGNHINKTIAMAEALVVANENDCGLNIGRFVVYTLNDMANTLAEYPQIFAAARRLDRKVIA